MINNSDACLKILECEISRVCFVLKCLNEKSQRWRFAVFSVVGLQYLQTETF